jgi:hypothetical protein
MSIHTPALPILGRRTADTLPDTEALGQDASDFAVLPGSAVYEHWAKLLRGGEITYDEFVDWMSPPRTLRQSHALCRLWDAFFDAATARRPR